MVNDQKCSVFVCPADDAKTAPEQNASPMTLLGNMEARSQTRESARSSVKQEKEKGNVYIYTRTKKEMAEEQSVEDIFHSFTRRLERPQELRNPRPHPTR